MIRTAPWRGAFGIAAILAGLMSGTALADDPADDGTRPPSKVRSEEDGAIDLSGFLDTAYGFIPLVIPITEPAVGYGAAGGLVFMDRPSGTPRPGLDRPNITMVGGLATENGTWGAMAGDVRHWGDNRVQTIAAGIYASINLDFFGIGKDSVLEDRPLRYNLEPLGGGVRGRYRFGDSRVSLGLTYVLARTKIRFDASGAPGEPSFRDDSRVGGLVPALTYDSRDNIFTPTRGTYAEGSAGLFDEAFGGDDSFQRVGLTYIGYWPLRTTKLTLGVRTNATFAFGDAPFYLLPYITLRGAPILRYQGEDAADLETEVRWQCWKRWSVVGFAGTGAAWNDSARLDNKVAIVTGGTGIRYELARKYGLHAGADVAYGPDGVAFYIQFGSAWARP